MSTRETTRKRKHFAFVLFYAILGFVVAGVAGWIIFTPHPKPELTGKYRWLSFPIAVIAYGLFQMSYWEWTGAAEYWSNTIADWVVDWISKLLGG